MHAEDMVTREWCGGKKKGRKLYWCLTCNLDSHLGRLVKFSSSATSLK